MINHILTTRRHQLTLLNDEDIKVVRRVCSDMDGAATICDLKEEASDNFFSPLSAGGMFKRRSGDIGMIFIRKFRDAAKESDYLSLLALCAGGLVAFGVLVLGVVVIMVHFAPALDALPGQADARPHAE